MKFCIVIAGALLAVCVSGEVAEIILDGTDALRNPCVYGKEMSITDLMKSAEGGNADAQFALARRYYDGDGVAEDCAEAFNWFKIAAEQGHNKAQCCLGRMYEGVGGVVSNFVEAAKWYHKAAEQGNAEGQRRFGELCIDGMGVAKNTAEGLEWYRKAAMQGDVYAAHELVDIYRFGYYDVEPDIEEAVKWRRVAAENGDPIYSCRNFDDGPYYPRILPARLGLFWAFVVYPVWWMFCLLRFLVRGILALFPSFAGRMKSKIVLPLWLMLLGLVPVICDSVIYDSKGWRKLWERYPGLVLSTAFCCVALLCLRWIKQRQHLKEIYVNIMIILFYALLLFLPEIHFAIYGK